MPSKPPPNGPINGWDYFDRIYCISLSDREERRRQAERQFQSVGLAGRVTFVIVDRHALDSEQGIYESHLQCIRQAISADARTLAIFEDDVAFRRFSMERLAACVEFLNTTRGWNAFFFGCLVRRSKNTSHPSVRAVSYRCLAHAYALSRPFAEILATKPWHGVPYDAMLSRFKEGLFAVYPSFAFQSDAPSDNARTRLLDRFRRRCGGLERIQKVDEWCHRHGRLLLVLHLLGLLGLAGLAFFWI